MWAYIQSYICTHTYKHSHFMTLEEIGGYLGLLSCRSWCKCRKIGKEVRRAFLEEMEDYRARGPVSTLLALLGSLCWWVEHELESMWESPMFMWHAYIMPYLHKQAHLWTNSHFKDAQQQDTMWVTGRKYIKQHLPMSRWYARHREELSEIRDYNVALTVHYCLWIQWNTVKVYQFIEFSDFKGDWFKMKKLNTKSTPQDILNKNTNTLKICYSQHY